MIRLFILFSTLVLASSALAFSPETASFSVSVNGDSVPYRVYSAFLMPGQAVDIAVSSVDRTLPLRLEVEGGGQVPTSPTSWHWQAPKKVGLYPINVVRSDTGEKVVLNAFVMAPYSTMKGEYLNGYHIGRYPRPFGKTYRLPEGFIEVTPANENTYLSPHFQLKQFLCKQAGNYPKYLVLRAPLLKKLETTLAAVNREGYHYDGFHIMSGYRTPYYNRSLGNVAFSRHMLGEAADVLFDGPTSRSIKLSSFFKIVDKSQRATGSGGLGKYHGTRAHGPFVHVDVRDYLARWDG